MVPADSVSLTDRKRGLRQVMTERRLGLAVAERARACALATERVGALPGLATAIARGGVVAGFVSTRAELDPEPALDQARARGAVVAYPRVGQGRPRLAFHVATRDALVPGAFGLWEPPATARAVTPEEIGFMLVPGLAFDRFGHRLGFGGGFYDEWLAASAGDAPGARLTVGLCYDFQVVDDCPAGPEDRAMDRIVTDLRTMTCERPAAAAPTAPVEPPPPEGS
jgi:5-formyltetrahydrofolate cyclo-ligase